jgi:zinc protease
VLTLGIAPGSPLRAFDLAAAEVTRLANGLTLLVLEDRVLPVVSVQMLYRAGARDEAPGTTGVAHFMEHMAFRASEGFPGTELASRIYAVGGEWHAYTWIDQTTYYETAPREHLDLLLRIEADRMARLLLPAEEVEAERGAVLAELHGYENDPASVLYDAVVATSFAQHPYRYNTIGWESDVEAITRRDLLAFYTRHYTPANAVLAVVGDIDAAAVADRVEELFSPLPAGAPTPPPRTREPEQRGLRRLEIEGDGGEARFAVAWRAPAATDPDWPAFLLLREVLGGGDGINFQQESFGVPVRAGTRLGSLPADATTYCIPTADPYLLVVAGTGPPDGERDRLEAKIETVVARLRDEPAGEDELAAARSRLAEGLLFDLQTTEDAAHQLAYFAGIGARRALLALPDALAAVGPREVQRVARRWLTPEKRTVGWYLPRPLEPPPPGNPPTRRRACSRRPGQSRPRRTSPSRSAAHRAHRHRAGYPQRKRSRPSRSTARRRAPGRTRGQSGRGGGPGRAPRAGPRRR